MNEWEYLDDKHRIIVGIPAVIGFAVTLVVWSVFMTALGELYQPGLKMLLVGLLMTGIGSIPMVLGADITRRWKENLQESSDL